MAKFKKITLRPTHYSPNEKDYVDVQINIDKDGCFYCEIPEHLSLSIQNIKDNRKKIEHNSFFSEKNNKQNQLFNTQFENLLADLQDFHDLATKATVTKRPVIVYYFGSTMRFALDKDGNIHRNAQESGTQWTDYGKLNTLYPTDHAKGYDITFGAMVEVEITEKYGDIEKISYESPIYHPEYNTPETKLLNQWCRLRLDPQENSNIKVIDYNPNVAIFFDNLMMGMAQVAKQFYDFFSQENHIEMISKENSLNLLPNFLE